MRYVAEIRQAAEHRIDLLQPLARHACEASHRTGRGRPEPADGCPAVSFCFRVLVAHITEQAVEGRAGRIGELCGDTREQRFEGLAVQRCHQAFECTAGRKHNARRQQDSFCALDQLRRAKSVERHLGKAVFKTSFGVCRERHEAEVLTHAGADRVIARLSGQG